MGIDHSALLQAVTTEVLACPECGGSLHLSESKDNLYCDACVQSWPIEDGIVHLMSGDMSAQESEWRLRERTMKTHRREEEQILAVVAKHHSFRVMYERARRFRGRFRPDDWIIDLGAGTGWYWKGTTGGRLILADFSLESLRVARQLLGDSESAIFLWTNAQKLPMKPRAVAGFWSVQVFQHFPAELLRRVQSELDKVLRDEFAIEVYNLNPAVFHKAIYRLTGRRLHCRGHLGDMELNRYSPREWKRIWRDFRGGRARISSNYSELFFHPDFHFMPQHYPLGLEHLLTRYVPGVAGLFARQAQLRIDAGAVR